MKALAWLLRRACVFLYMAAMLAVLAGFLMNDHSGWAFLQHVFPRFRPLLMQLHPHAVQIMIGCGLAAVFFFLAGGGVGAVKGKPSIVHGSAHFASWYEIWQAGFAPARSHTRLVLGRRGVQTVAVSEARQREHVLLVAPTGQGKTSGVIIPGLLKERGTRGLFVNDVKGELHEKCGGALGRSMRVSVFAPLRPEISVHYNPLAHVKTTEDAEDLAAAWVQNTTVAREPYWNDTACLLMTAVILHLQEAEPGAPFSRLADILGAATFDQVRVILSRSPSVLARDLGASFLNNVSADPKLAGGLMSGMATRFLMMRNPTIRALTATDSDAAKNMTFEGLVNDPQALFLSVPAQDTRRLKPLMACLVMQLMVYLARKKADRGFAFYLDELCNAGRIPHYAEHISLVRSQGLALIQVIQDFGQLRREYGRDDAATILANSNTKVFFPGVGKEEATYASELLGERTMKTVSYTRRDGSYSDTQSYIRRRLMTADEIRRMPRGQELVVYSNVAPMIVQNTPYFKRRSLRRLAGLPPAA